MGDWCTSGWENLCLDVIDGHLWGVAFEVILLLYSFIGVAIVADNHLVVALETLCVRWDVREDVAGASFMAFGSAAPEIVINAISTIKTVISAIDQERGDIDMTGDGEDAALGVGAILGSGMIAFSVIPGVCGIFAGADTPLKLKRRPLARDVIAYSTSLLWLAHTFSDGLIDTFESATMLVGYGAPPAAHAFHQHQTGSLTRHSRGPQAWLCLPLACLTARPLSLWLAGAYLLVVVFSSGLREHYRVQWLKKNVRLGESFVLSSAVASSAATPTPSEANCRDSSLKGRGSYDPPLPPSPASAGSLKTRVHFCDTPNLTAEGSPFSPDPDSGYCDEKTPGIESSQTPRFFKEDEAPERMLAARRALGSAVSASIYPLEWLIGASCPECQYDGKQAMLYPVTLASAFLWVAALSLIISAVVSRFGALLNLPAAFLGMYIIAVGAEIPDTIQSVTVAKRGYGSMAVSNSCGSQILNILVGLGLPWFLSNWAGIPISILQHDDLALMAAVQCVILTVFTALLLGATVHTWRRGDHRKASLGPGKGAAMLLTYAACVAGYPLLHHLLSRQPSRANRFGPDL
jgi:Ca2+/Na+ antiporter